MRYFQIISTIFIMMLVAASCVNKVTCPAYQSQYFLDTAYLRKTFSLFIADSVPDEKIGDVKKTRYGISDEPAYRKKVRDMNSIEMVTIYPGYEDSIMMVRAIADSVSTDSIPTATASTSSRIMLNYDQLLYNSMYGALLYKPRKSDAIDIKEELEVDDTGVADSIGVKKKGRFKLFRKKNKSADTSEDTDIPEIEEPQPVLQEETEDDGF